jgi:adenylate cyclase
VSTRRQRVHRFATGVGLLTTLLVLVVYALGGLDWLELKTLDLRFQYANGAREDPRLVCIDIDDDSIENIKRWPWPRDLQAAIIGVLDEAGLRALLYDVELSEPEPLRSSAPESVDVTYEPGELAATQPRTHYPDALLATTFALLENAYLAYHYEHTPDAADESGTLDARFRAWVAEHALAAPAPIPALLSRAFEEIAGGNAALLERSKRAFRDALNYHATVANPLTTPERVAPVAPSVPGVAPVYFRHAQVARRCGFVVYVPDRDGIMRRMPLLVEHHGRVLAQLAFAVACDVLELSPDRISARPGWLELDIPQRPQPLRIQLDKSGRTLVPWLPQRDWTRQLGRHIPIDAVWQIHDRRMKIAANRAIIAVALETLLTRPEYTAWEQLTDDLQVWLRDDQLQRAALTGDLAEYTRQRDLKRQYDELIVADLHKLLTEFDQQPPATAPTSTAPGDDPVTGASATIRAAVAANDAFRTEIADFMAWLRPRVADKIGIVGYTASALADMTPTPVSPRAPGVVAHANMLNGLLTGRMVYWAPLWLNAALTLLAGVAATWISVRWPIRGASIGSVLLIAVFIVLAGWLPFQTAGYWIALTPGIAAILLSAVAILLFRYMFLERESQHIAAALSQYTSAALARQMAEDAELCKRAEMRDVSAMFTDLAGFTTISERIGAARTQHILNVSLGRFSDAILRHEGMINKFIGDGIFAFWNPVIYPQEDHARRACQTAIDLQRALAALVAEQRTAGGDEAFAALHLRIGVATGNAIVGPCGSEQKYDYTCIGDSVNVAARLESANKFYGTRILISGATVALAGDDFALRPLGGVQVKGKTRAVPIFELIGDRADADAETLAYAERFAAAVTHFEQCRWSEALATLEDCRRQRPDDRAVEQFIAATRAYQQTPPPPDWSGAIELTEK